MMAEQTVREQLAEAMETCVGELTNIDASFKERWEASKVGIAALDRHRAEPEGVDGCICPDCPRCSAAKDEDDTCACWQAGHATGLEVKE